jgi:integrase
MSRARSHKCLSVADWPLADREAWRIACDDSDEFSAGGIAGGWAPRSRQNAELAYGRLIGFLRRHQRLNAVDRVGQRLVLEDLQELGYELSSQLAPYTVRGIYSSLGMAVRAMDPSADRRILNQIAARLARTARSVRNISGNLLTPQELVAIGVAMMEEAESNVRHSWRRASIYRDGLLIMFMALCPLRPGAVSEMQLGTNLIVDGDKVVIRFPAQEKKKRRVEDVPVPKSVADRFRRYIALYRPMFPRPSPCHADAVWLSRNGLPLSRDSLSKRIKERTARRTGKRFTAHMFRHASASHIVDVAPEQARMVVGVLGHSGFRTAQQHYIKGQQLTAVRYYQRAVSDLQKRGRKKGGGCQP